jgi:hypothetical protein
MPERIHNGFAIVTIFGSFCPASYFQPPRLDADLDLVRKKSGYLHVRDEMIVGFYNLQFHRPEQLGFREKPVLPVVSVHVSAAFENLECAPSHHIDHVLRVFEKFTGRHAIQISASGL